MKVSGKIDESVLIGVIMCNNYQEGSQPSHGWMCQHETEARRHALAQPLFIPTC